MANTRERENLMKWTKSSLRNPNGIFVFTQILNGIKLKIIGSCLQNLLKKQYQNQKIVKWRSHFMVLHVSCKLKTVEKSFILFCFFFIKNYHRNFMIWQGYFLCLHQRNLESQIADNKSLLTFSTNSYRTLIYFCCLLWRKEFLNTKSEYSHGDNILFTQTSVRLSDRK